MRFQVEVHWRQDKALGSEESSVLGGGHFYEQRIETKHEIYFLLWPRHSSSG
jgi:hypothetical protein